MKKESKLVVWVFTVLFLGIFLLDILGKERSFSANENRMLAKRPDFQMENFWNKTFGKDYEDYLSDQFLFRNQWIFFKTYADIGLQKKDVKGVYLGKDNTLIEQHLPQDMDWKQIRKKLDRLNILIEDYAEKIGSEQVKVMFVPTADNVWQEKLPAYAPYFAQSDFLKEAEKIIGRENMVQVYEYLLKHEKEEIYYRSDHHWTTLGAYYGYEAWADSMGIVPVLKTAFIKKTVTKDFLGTLHSKTNIILKPDNIEIFLSPFEEDLEVIYDMGQEKTNSLYAPEYLDTKNKYGIFLKDNHPFIEIQTGVKNNRTLFVIKDSFANCFIPFLTTHYETICIVDLRYYKMNLYELIDKQDTTDILVLYDVIHFIEEFYYY